MKMDSLKFTSALTPALSPTERGKRLASPDNSSILTNLTDFMLSAMKSAILWRAKSHKSRTTILPLLGERAGVRASVNANHWLARLPALLATAVILFATPSAIAADFSSAFNAANELYAKGKFAEAAGAYEKILQSSAVSPALYFNYGNAEFKSGNLGRAIATYRRAAELAPRDAEVRANLDFTRSQVQGPVLRENRWSRLAGRLDFLTLNEWTGLAVVTVWLMFGLLAVRQIRPSLKPVLGGLTKLAVAAAILACACLGVNAAIHFSKQIAVVIASDAVARSGPFDEAQNAFAVHDGAELAVVDQKNGWWEVTDGSGRIGWLPQKQVEILPGS
jgi:tetratricopeptide (TPR) repeat protein